MFSRIQSTSLSDPGIGQVAALLGDLGHLVEELLLAGEQLRVAIVVQRPSVAASTAATWTSSSACSSLLGKRGPVVVAADGCRASRSSSSWHARRFAAASA